MSKVTFRQFLTAMCNDYADTARYYRLDLPTDDLCQSAQYLARHAQAQSNAAYDRAIECRLLLVHVGSRYLDRVLTKDDLYNLIISRGKGIYTYATQLETKHHIRRY